MEEYNPAHVRTYLSALGLSQIANSVLNKHSKVEDLKVKIYLVTAHPVCVAQRVSDHYWDIRVGNTRFVGGGDIEVILEGLLMLLGRTSA